jgi:hypothetical protein
MVMNRRGNPDIDKHFIQPMGDNPLLGHLQVRIDSQDLAKLKELPNWREVLRIKIREIVAGG